MAAITAYDGAMMQIKPTVSIAAGSVVKLSDQLIGVAPTAIAANSVGYVQLYGEYIIDVTPGTAYEIGAGVETAAKTLDGADATVNFGPALLPVATTDASARARLIAFKPVKSLLDSTGGTAAAELVAPAASSYTTEELKANFASIAAALG